MSNTDIRIALETQISAIGGGIDTAWENAEYKPIANVPYQQVNVLFARPNNPTLGQDYYRQTGYMQIMLMYLQNNGPRDASDRAELIRKTFHRGLTLSANGIEVTVEPTPEIGSASFQGDRYVIPVRVYFYSNVFTENE